MRIDYHPVAWDYNAQDVVTLLRVIHLHCYLPNTKAPQAFEFVDFNHGPHHEVISKYQVQPFGLAGTLDGHVLNELLIFIPPHLTHPWIHHFVHCLLGISSVPGYFLLGSLYLVLDDEIQGLSKVIPNFGKFLCLHVTSYLIDGPGEGTALLGNLVVVFFYLWLHGHPCIKVNYVCFGGPWDLVANYNIKG